MFLQYNRTTFAFAAHPTTFVSNSVTIAAGSLVAVIFDMGGLPSGSVVTVSDGTHSFTNLVGGHAVHATHAGFFSGYGNFTDIWFFENHPGGTITITVTVSASGSNNADIHILEYSGVALSGSAIGYLASNGSQVGAATISASTIGTGSGTNNIVVSLFKNDGSNGTAWSITDRSGGVVAPFAEAGDQASTAPGGEAVTMTVSGTAKWDVAAIVFKLAGGAPPPRSTVCIMQ